MHRQLRPQSSFSPARRHVARSLAVARRSFQRRDLSLFNRCIFFFFPISRLVFGYSLIQRGNIAFCVAHVFTSSNKISYSIICYLISIDIPLYHFPPPLSGTRTRESVPRIVDRDYSRSPGVPGCVTKTFGSIGCFYDK